MAVDFVYKVVFGAPPKMGDAGVQYLEDLINGYGAQGWEISSVESWTYHGRAVVVFKKAILPAAAQRGLIAGIAHATNEYTVRLDFVQGTNGDPFSLLTYVGRALAGSLETEAKWNIRKLEYDNNGDLIAIKWADASTKFKKVWADRAAYSYS